MGRVNLSISPVFLFLLIRLIRRCWCIEGLVWPPEGGIIQGSKKLSSVFFGVSLDFYCKLLFCLEIIFLFWADFDLGVYLSTILLTFGICCGVKSFVCCGLCDCV